jgi:formyltetrahydrofolate synthetase
MAETTLPSSLEIAQAAELRPIAELAEEIGLEPDEIALYGNYKAKIDLSVLERLRHLPDGKLVCTTAVTPTKAGEGKTTTSAEVATIAALVARAGSAPLRGDAVVAAEIAQAGARGAAELVAVNLAGRDDARVRRAQELAATTREAARRAAGRR